MRISKNIILLTIMLMLAANPFAAASLQDKKKDDQDSIKLKAQLVQIDVLVTDKSGQPVSGLKREDFELFDNGKPQIITNFSYEEARSRRAEQSKDARPAESMPRTITSGELHRVVAFVVDTLHMNIYSVYSARKMLQDFIEHKMEPGDLAVILPTGGGSGLLQQFTSDRRLLSRAVSRLRPLYFSGASTPFRSLEARSPSLGNRIGEQGLRPVSGALSMPDGSANAAGRIDPLEEADARNTLNTLNALIKSMSKMPGRKISVLVSQGFRVYRTRTMQDVNRTTALAARANVVFYAIDPNGLDPGSLGADDAIIKDEQTPLTDAIGQALGEKRANSFEAQDSLNTLALETGGKFFRSNNDIISGLGKMLSENSAYYMLGFQPEGAKWDGKIHKIKVTARNRPDLEIAFRKSYLAKSDQPADSYSSPAVAEAMEAISSPFIRRDIDLKLTPLYIDNPQRDANMTILLHIDAGRLNFRKVDGRYQTKLEQVGFVFDANGNAVDRFANDIDLDLKEQTYESALKRGLVATRRLNLKPGLYQVKLFIREMESRLIGTANDYFDVPDLKSDRLAMSSIFTSGQTLPQGKTADSAGESGTLANRVFQRSGEFAYSLVIYNAKTEGKSAQPQLEMRTRILKGAKIIFSGAPRAVSPAEGSALPFKVVTGGALQLKGLEPGDYTLEVTVTDKARKKDSRATVRQEIDFSVE